MILFAKNLLPYFMFGFTVLVYLWSCHSDLSANYLKLRSLLSEACQELTKENEAKEIECSGATCQPEQTNELSPSKSQMIYPDENDVPRIPKTLHDMKCQEMPRNSTFIKDNWPNHVDFYMHTCLFRFHLFLYNGVWHYKGSRRHTCLDIVNRDSIFWHWA